MDEEGAAVGQGRGVIVAVDGDSGTVGGATASLCKGDGRRRAIVRKSGTTTWGRGEGETGGANGGYDDARKWEAGGGERRSQKWLGRRHLFNRLSRLFGEVSNLRYGYEEEIRKVMHGLNKKPQDMD